MLELTEPRLAECSVMVRKLLECADCCFHSINKQELESHMQKVHFGKRDGCVPRSRATKVSKPKGGSKSKNFQCSVCQFQCKHPEILAWHSKNFHGDKPVVKMNENTASFQCIICKKEFEKFEQICSHMSSLHNINLPFQCEICSKKFLRKAKLTNHKHTHDGRTYTCDVCDAKYKSKSGLNRHKESAHTEQQVVKCDVCKKNYKSAQSLKIHKSRCHAKNKPFSCNVCFKRFSQKCQLNQHNRTSHLVGHLDCKFCNDRFFTYKEYNMHQYYQHKNQAKYEYNTSPNKSYLTFNVNDYLW